MQDLIEQFRSWAEILGPNIYLQAVIVAVAFILFGKLADLVISRIIAKVVSRTSSEFDDELVALLHRPVFVTFVLFGLVAATRLLRLPESP